MMLIIDTNLLILSKIWEVFVFVDTRPLILSWCKYIFLESSYCILYDFSVFVF